MCKERGLHITDLEHPESGIIRVAFHSKILKESRPVLFAPNHSSIFHAVGFDTGAVALVRMGPTGWREECILARGEDFLRGSARLKKLWFSLTGEFLFVLDSGGAIERFIIRENLGFTNSINLLKLSQNPRFDNFVKNKRKQIVQSQEANDLMRNYS